LEQDVIGLKNLLIEVISIFEESDAYIEFIIKDNVPKNIICDKNRLKQILLNLLKNAEKYTKKGSIVIEIDIFKEKDNKYNFEYKKKDKPEYNLLFKIKDNGTGINKKMQEDIKIILGLEKNNYRRPTIFSFGLIITKYLCSLMGGNLWFKSALDIGTTFFFNILCKGV